MYDFAWFFQFPCGVIDENENTEEGIIENLKLQHQLVSGHGSDNLVRLFSVGDLLTVEGQQNAQENLQDSPNISARLEGWILALADFHMYGIIMEVFHFIFLLFSVILVYYYGNNIMSEIEIDWKSLIEIETNESKEKVAYLYFYFDSGCFHGDKTLSTIGRTVLKWTHEIYQHIANIKELGINSCWSGKSRTVSVCRWQIWH